MNATLAHDGLLPRPAGGNGAGAALALLVHAGLIAALSVSVDWRSQPQEAVSAELWASVPQQAVPRATEPAPLPLPDPTPAPPPAPAPAPRAQAPPPEPDIATERAARRKTDAAKKQADADALAARRKLDADSAAAKADKAEKTRRAQAVAAADAASAARTAKADEQRLAQQREANLQRMMGQAGDASGRSTGAAAQSAGPSAGYAGRVAALIRRASVFTGTVAGNPAAEVEVRAAPSGTIIARRLVKSSGSAAWDDAVLQAIDKAGTLPRDVDGRVPPLMIVAFKPNE